jgi:NAD(P)-dependent dehydrogenase (short-subunit alcohol dehydrogenase family)
MPVAIITGGGGGIGRAAAIRLAELGHHIALAGRTIGALEAVAGEVKRAGVESLVIPTDVTKPDHVDAMVKKVLDSWGEINVLVNTAGLAPMVPTHEVSTPQWHEILDTNLSSAFYAIRAVWPHMQRQHYEFIADHRDKQGAAHLPANVTSGGSIINISSMSTRDPFPGLGAYAVAKSGLNMLTHVTAREGEPLGIRVIGIAPGAVETGMFRAMFDTDQVPAEDVLRPSDVAEMIASFVSGALRHSSGETIFMHKRL